jgi:predicted Zn-dependent peptidase
MKNYVLPLIWLLTSQQLQSQEVRFQEYDLSNGLHVILHQDNSVPIVTTSVLYHVGSKHENPFPKGQPLNLLLKAI